MLTFLGLCFCAIAFGFTVIWCRLMYEVWLEIDYIQCKRMLDRVKLEGDKNGKKRSSKKEENTD